LPRIRTMWIPCGGRTIAGGPMRGSEVGTHGIVTLWDAWATRREPRSDIAPLLAAQEPTA